MDTMDKKKGEQTAWEDLVVMWGKMEAYVVKPEILDVVEHICGVVDVPDTKHDSPIFHILPEAIQAAAAAFWSRGAGKRRHHEYAWLYV